jgi:hypothetical protein
MVRTTPSLPRGSQPAAPARGGGFHFNKGIHSREAEAGWQPGGGAGCGSLYFVFDTDVRHAPIHST